MPRQVHSRVFAISAAVILGLCATGDMVDAGDLKHAVETAEVIHTFDLQGAALGRAIAARDVFVFQLQKSDSSIIAAFTNFGDLRFWRSRPSSGRPVLVLEDVSEDGSTVTLSQDSGYYQWQHLAVDRNGATLCEFPVEASMQSSPTGRYFCPTPEFEEPFEVFDRSGHRVEVNALPGPSWSATFVTDSLIGFTSQQQDHRGVFIHIPAVYASDSNRSSNQSESNSLQTTPQTSHCGPIATLNWRGLVYVFALLDDGPRTWKEADQFAFASDCGDWIAAVSDNVPDSGGYIQIASTKDQAVSTGIQYSSVWWRGWTCSWCPDIASLSNDVVAILGVYAWSSGWGDGLHVPHQTCFAEFDSDSLTISEPFAVHGIYLKARGEIIGEDTYLRVYPPDTVQLVHLNR